MPLPDNDNLHPVEGIWLRPRLMEALLTAWRELDRTAAAYGADDPLLLSCLPLSPGEVELIFEPLAVELRPYWPDWPVDEVNHVADCLQGLLIEVFALIEGLPKAARFALRRRLYRRWRCHPERLIEDLARVINRRIIIAEPRLN